LKVRIPVRIHSNITVTTLALSLGFTVMPSC
jgi:hypothetical protein